MSLLTHKHEDLFSLQEELMNEIVADGQTKKSVPGGEQVQNATEERSNKQPCAMVITIEPSKKKKKKRVKKRKKHADGSIIGESKGKIKKTEEALPIENPSSMYYYEESKDAEAETSVQVESSNNASVDPAKAIKQAQSEISIIRLESSEVEDGVYEREGKIDEEKPKRGRKSLHSKFGKNKYKIVPEEEHPLISSKSVETEQEGDGSEEGENRNGKTKAIPILKQLSMESLEDGLIQQSMISAMDRRSIRDFQTIDEAAEHGQITENRVGSIDPDCRWIQAWNVFIMCIVAYQVLEIPYHISFGYSGSAVGVLVVNYMTDTIFIVAMYLKTRLGYYDTGNKIMHRPLLWQHYFRTWQFKIDIIAIIPLDFLQIPLGRLHPSLRLLKILRLYELEVASRKVGRALGTKYELIRFIKMIFYVFYISHIIACGWWIVGEIEGYGSDKWVPSNLLLYKSQAFVYLSCLHWSLGLMTGLSDGEIPVTPLESMYTYSAMLIGLFMFGTIIGNVNAIVENMERKRDEFMNNTSKVRRFIKYHDLPKHLMRRAVDYYSYTWGDADANETSLISELPQDLQTDVLFYLMKDVIEKVPFFQGCEIPFLRSLVNQLEPVIASPGEYLVRIGTPGTEMYFVVSGRLDVVVGDQENRVNEMKQGDYFGEASLLSGLPRSASVIASTYCKLYKLSHERLNSVLEIFPDTAKSIQLTTQQAKRKAKQRESVMKKRPNEMAKNASKGIFKSTQSLSMHALGKDSKFVRFLEFLETYVMLPSSPIRTKWVVVMMICYTYNVYTIPMQAVFFFKRRRHIGAVLLDAFIDLFYFVDIWVCLRLAFMENGSLVKDPTAIRQRYTKGGMMLDIISSLPLDWILNIAGVTKLEASFISALRINRLLRVAYFGDLFNELDRVSSNYMRNKLFRLIFFLLTIIHYNACLFFAFTLFEGLSPYSEAWLPPLTLEWNDTSAFPKYLRSIYYSFSSLAGLGKGLRPLTEAQLVFTLITMILGVLVFAYLISTVGSLVTNLDSDAVKFKFLKNGMEEFMQHRKVPRDLRYRVRAYFDYWWSSQRGMKPQSVLESLPDTLEREVRMHLCADMIKNVPLFYGCSDAFVRDLIRVLEFELYPQAEFIFRKNHATNGKMYFVTAGVVEIEVKDDLLQNNAISMKFNAATLKTVVFRALGPGSFFGEYVIFEKKHSISVRSRTACELLVLHVKHLLGLLEKYPSMKKQVYAVIEKRHKKLTMHNLLTPTDTKGGKIAKFM